MVHQRCFGDRLAAIPDALGGIKHRVVIEDGTGAEGPPGGVDYEEAIAGGSPDRDFGPRSADDIYILYTGGTTGMPKGVVWRHEDVLFALGGGLSPVTGEKITSPGGLVERGLQAGPTTSLPIAPLMHGATQWSVMGGSFTGNKSVLVAHFDPDEVWRLVGEEQVNLMMITGDAMARPLIEALEKGGTDYDLSSLFALSSTAAVFSPSVKDQFLAHFPNLVLTDSIGSSESGATGYSVIAKGKTAMKGGPTVTPVGETVVFDEQLRRVEAGSGVVGKLARAGYLPLRYYKDEAKSAETFVESEGKRWAIPGDLAMVEEDGSITLLGRGSVSINTGGEKVFPEEVESAIKSHPDAYDAVVVGVPDDRWGERVAAVVEARPGVTPTLEDLQAHCRTKLAGYKVPRELHLVDKVQRSPSGKPDYPWAKRLATEGVPTGG
jgi:3-oxocholest-4-en-26-oate---CoA ligase